MEYYGLLVTRSPRSVDRHWLSLIVLYSEFRNLEYESYCMIYLVSDLGSSLKLTVLDQSWRFMGFNRTVHRNQTGRSKKLKADGLWEWSTLALWDRSFSYYWAVYCHSWKCVGQLWRFWTVLFDIFGPSTFILWFIRTVHFDPWPSTLSQLTVQFDSGTSTFTPLDRPL